MNFKKTVFILSLAFTICSYAVHAQKIAAGGWHSLVVCADSTVKAFGENATGQIGDGTNTDRNVPTTVPGLTGIVAVSAGGDQLEAHSVALKSDGTVWAWGSNLYGGLGNASLVNTTAPVQAITLSNVVAISAGGWHTVALKSDSTVWTWGWNIDGQLGDGTTTDRTIAGKVNGLSGVVAIEAGTYHVLALKADGTVWAWGDNVSGQIGNGTTTDQTTPIQVSGLTDVVKIATGRFFSLAVKSDGTIWTWGENLYGQLGDGTTTDRTTPVQVTSFTGGVLAVTCGAFEVHVIKNDRTVWAWGRNTYGNIGDGTVVNRSLPVQMVGITDAEGLASGTNFALVYKTDGTFWGCGRNLSGQLGDGTFLQRNELTKSTLVCPIIQQPNGISSPDGLDLIAVSAFPNPSASGKFTLQFSENANQFSNTNVEIYDLVGKKVFQSAIDWNNSNAPFSIDLSNQANGIYFMTISAAGQRISQKLIKQ
jgi:alpha-tubulin suppressor-like RCC1 family protein